MICISETDCFRHGEERSGPSYAKRLYKAIGRRCNLEMGIILNFDLEFYASGAMCAGFLYVFFDAGHTNLTQDGVSCRLGG